MTYVSVTDASGRLRLLVAEGDAAARQVVGAELDADAIADEDADVELAHLPGGVREHLLPGLQPHLEHRVRKGLDDRGVHLDRLLLDVLDRGRTCASGGTAGRTPARCAGTGGTTAQKDAPGVKQTGERASR